MTLIDLKRYGAKYLAALAAGAVSVFGVVVALLAAILAGGIVVGIGMELAKIPNVILWIAGALIVLPVVGWGALKWVF